jgi:hypothetical protein
MATSLLVHVHKRLLLGSALIPTYLAGTGCVCASYSTVLPFPTSEGVPKHILAFTKQYGTGAGRQGSCPIVHSARDRSSPSCLFRIFSGVDAGIVVDYGVDPPHTHGWTGAFYLPALSAQSYGLFCRLDVLRESRYSLVCWRPRRSRSGSRNLLTWRAVR